jgi:hypothetical protein
MKNMIEKERREMVLEMNDVHRGGGGQKERNRK